MENITGRDELQANKSGGYDVEFVDKHVSKQNLKCSICLLVLKKPMQAAPCGHRFCKECIDAEKKRQETLLCPYDQMAIQVFPDAGREKEMLEYQVKCPNSECEWTGELRSFEKHLEQCEFQVLECEKKCGRKDILRKEMMSHLEDECTNNLTNCDFSSIGCQFKGKLKELENHMEVSSPHHLLLQNERILMLEKDFLKANEENTELKSKVADSATEMTRMKRKNEEDVSKLKWDIEELLSYHKPKCPFTYTIKNVSLEMMMEKKRFFESEVFELFNGYRGRLIVCLNYPESDKDQSTKSDKKFVGVSLEIVEGPYDDVLQWPMMFDKVHFKCIINGECVKEMSFEHGPKLQEVFNRPTLKRKDNVKNWGFSNFLNQSNIPDDLDDDLIKICVDITKAL